MNPYYADESVTLHHGDALTVLASLPDASLDCCVTSPPYFGLRDYGVDGQLGLEASPVEYVDAMRAVFAEVRRVLADDGTLWLNIGDSYSVGSVARHNTNRPNANRDGTRAGHVPRHGVNPGDVWSLPTQPFGEAHFACMPVALAQRCIQAGCKVGGTVLDPFSGSGTTGLAATRLGHNYVGIDLNRDYLDLSLRTRLAQGSLNFGASA